MINSSPKQRARADSETLALNALAFLASDANSIGAFLASCGADIESVRTRAADPEFLGFVLDHLLQDDDSVIAFAAAQGIAPEEVMRARAALPGGDAPHWT